MDIVLLFSMFAVQPAVAAISFSGQEANAIYASLEAMGLRGKGINKAIFIDDLVCDSNGPRTECAITLNGRHSRLPQDISSHFYSTVLKMKVELRSSRTQINWGRIECYDLGMFDVRKAVCSVSPRPPR